MEYGGNVERLPEPNVMYSQKGFQMVGRGFRIDLDNYKDLIRWVVYQPVNTQLCYLYPNSSQHKIMKAIYILHTQQNYLNFKK